MSKNILSIRINSILLQKTKVLLKFKYILGKLEDGTGRYYYPKKLRQCIFFNVIKKGIEEKKR